MHTHMYLGTAFHLPRTRPHMSSCSFPEDLYRWRCHDNRECHLHTRWCLQELEIRKEIKTWFDQFGELTFRRKPQFSLGSSPYGKVELHCVPLQTRPSSPQKPWRQWHRKDPRVLSQVALSGTSQLCCPVLHSSMSDESVKKYKWNKTRNCMKIDPKTERKSIKDHLLGKCHHRLQLDKHKSACCLSGCNHSFLCCMEL